MSAERPILFSGPMVRAILDGRKSETRRILRVAGMLASEFVEPSWGGVFYAQENPKVPLVHSKDGTLRSLGPCPYGAPGDLLWVRETWRLEDFEGTDGRYSAAVGFRADGAKHPTVRKRGGVEIMDERCGWRPSIHLPKRFARLWLLIEDARAERLQEITREGAIAEGAFEAPDHEKQQAARVALSEGRHEIGPRDYFRELWDSINGDRAPWTSNPWVWVVKFSRTEAP